MLPSDLGSGVNVDSDSDPGMGTGLGVCSGSRSRSGADSVSDGLRLRWGAGIDVDDGRDSGSDTDSEAGTADGDGDRSDSDADSVARSSLAGKSSPDTVLLMEREPRSMRESISISIVRETRIWRNSSSRRAMAVCNAVTGDGTAQEGEEAEERRRGLFTAMGESLVERRSLSTARR